jgi:hypothetical protein
MPPPVKLGAESAVQLEAATLAALRDAEAREARKAARASSSVPDGHWAAVVDMMLHISYKQRTKCERATVALAVRIVELFSQRAVVVNCAYE